VLYLIYLIAQICVCFVLCFGYSISWLVVQTLIPQECNCNSNCTARARDAFRHTNYRALMGERSALKPLSVKTYGMLTKWVDG
jgi:hypothetical protein